jgi:nicotinamidase-related amidase
MTARSKATSLRKSSELFLDFLDTWYSNLKPISLKSLLKKFPAEQTAIACVDVVNGFCKEGNLSSPRVAKIIDPIVQLVKNAEQHGINYYLLPQDTHPEHSKEFEIYPRHCVEGTFESRTVQELSDLPNSYKFKVIPKVTINPALEEQMQDWLLQNPEVCQFIITGDCTDICIHQLAMHLKLQSIKKDKESEIIVPVNCVDTFDISMDQSKSDGLMPHPGEIFHIFTLYHMHLNGIRIVSAIE